MTIYVKIYNLNFHKDHILSILVYVYISLKSQKNAELRSKQHRSDKWGS